MTTKDLIAEMTENVNKYGSENMTTYLMVQAIKELGRLAAVEAEHDALRAQNSAIHHAIKDAGWHPGRTDDLLTDIIRRKGEEVAELSAQVEALSKPKDPVFPYMSALSDFPDLTPDDLRKTARELSELQDRLIAEAAPQPLTRPAVPDKGLLADLIREHMTGVYHCGRVWEAWNVGTMSEDDFSPYAESDSPDELADAIIAMLAAAPQPEGGA